MHISCKPGKIPIGSLWYCDNELLACDHGHTDSPKTECLQQQTAGKVKNNIQWNNK